MLNLEKTVLMPAEGQELKASLTIVHGMAEHHHRYDAFAKYLSEQGIGVFYYDLPGHGAKVEKENLGYFHEETGDQVLIDSAVEAVRESKEIFKNVPNVLMGHSMGSMICRCYLQEHDAEIDGLILSGAPNYQSAVGLGITLGKVIRTFKGKKGHSKMMDNIVTGQFNKVVENPKSSSDWISYSQENIDRYNADPLCGFPFTVQGYIDELTLMKRMHDPSNYKVTKKDLPIYFFDGKDDPCRGGDEGWKDSIDTLKKAGYTNIRDQLYDHMRHETLNETDNLTVFKDVATFILSII